MKITSIFLALAACAVAAPIFSDPRKSSVGDLELSKAVFENDILPDFIYKSIDAADVAEKMAVEAAKALEDARRIADDPTISDKATAIENARRAAEFASIEASGATYNADLVADLYSRMAGDPLRPDAQNLENSGGDSKPVDDVGRVRDAASRASTASAKANHASFIIDKIARDLEVQERAAGSTKPPVNPPANSESLVPSTGSNLMNTRLKQGAIAAVTLSVIIGSIYAVWNSRRRRAAMNATSTTNSTSVPTTVSAPFNITAKAL